MRKMYPAIVNSPKTELATAITQTQTDISVTDPSVLLPGEGIAVIGNGETAETITYTSVEGNTLKGCLRGYQGIARAWTPGTRVARNFAAADWDAARENILELADRLDTPERTAITLQPGIHVVQAEQEAPFSLNGLKGRTLVNLLGRVGGMEDLSKIGYYNSSIASDSTNKVQGLKGLMVAVSESPSGVAAISTSVKAGKYYIFIVEAKNGNSTKVTFSLPAVGLGKESSSSVFTPMSIRYAPSQDGTFNIDMGVVGPSGSYAYFDAVRQYEVSEAEYNALASMTDEQAAAKYPYVDSVQPVRNPYAIRYGENLLPPFYDEWQNAPRNDSTGKGSISSPYEYTVVANAAESWIGSPWIPAIPGKAYTFSAEHNGQIHLVFADKDKIAISGTGYAAGQTATLVAPVNAAYVVAYFRNTGSAAGTFSIKNPMLVLGTTAKPFKPREDVMLALQADLYANPLTGANADEVFEKDGQYFKLAKWKKASIIPTGDYGVNASSYTGYKQVTLFMPKNVDTSNVAAYMTKYDGKLLELDRVSSPFPKSDLFNVGNESNKGYVWTTVSNADSGWGDSYNPTAAEIKAYFMGWIMYLSGTGGSGKSGITPYNGTGTKYWARVASDGNTLADGTAVLPTTQAPSYTPYQLVYQLATPTVEPITSEGQLTFFEGDNQIEVGTGIVLREGVKPYVNSSIGYAGINAPSSPNYPGTGLQTKVSKLLKIYKNGRDDNEWNVQSGGSITGGGEEYADIKLSQYDASATYTVTYLMLDTFPAAPFVGSVAENEKALLTDLVQDVQQATARLSVVESKKAEKGSPAWITPTLVNGWIQYPGYPTAQYVKDSSENVHIRGLIKDGVRDAGKRLFVLPEGFRPKTRRIFNVLSFETPTPVGTTVEITEDGNVYLGSTAASLWLNLEGISFNINI